MSSVAYAALACWVLVELGVRVREAARRQGSPARDRGTRVLIVVALGAAIAIAFAARTDVPSLAMPPALRFVGAVVLWLGLALRVWAIGALGRAFRTTVEVDSGQAVVSTGPYRWIRHPSYTGLLLIVGGIGLALGNWLSLAACLALPIPAFVRRIQVEEAELERVLGDPYRAYEARTARLIPGLW